MVSGLVKIGKLNVTFCKTKRKFTVNVMGVKLWNQLYGNVSNVKTIEKST